MSLLRLKISSVVVLALAACDGSGDAERPPSLEQGRALRQQGGQEIISERVGKNSYVFSAEDSQGSTFTDTHFEVRKPQRHVHAPGDVLIVDDHGGKLIRITAVEDLLDSIRYSHEPASLMEAFDGVDSFRFEMKGALTREDLGETFDTGNPEITLKWADK